MTLTAKRGGAGAAIVALMLSASVLCAQAPTVAAAQVGPRGCTYSTCNLTLETVRGKRVLRQGSGATLAFGESGGGLVRAVVEVPVAQREARVGRGIEVTGTTVAFVGMAVGILRGFTAFTGRVGRPDRIGSGLAIVGGSFAFGVLVGSQAKPHFQRAITAYNDALPR